MQKRAASLKLVSGRPFRSANPRPGREMIWAPGRRPNHPSKIEISGSARRACSRRVRRKVSARPMTQSANVGRSRSRSRRRRRSRSRREIEAAKEKRSERKVASCCCCCHKFEQKEQINWKLIFKFGAPIEFAARGPRLAGRSAGQTDLGAPLDGLLDGGQLWWPIEAQICFPPRTLVIVAARRSICELAHNQRPARAEQMDLPSSGSGHSRARL